MTQPGDDRTPEIDRTLDGRRVLVTGASSGIGRATALAIAAAGGRPALLARSVSTLDDVAAEIAARTGPDAVVVPADVADPSATTAAVERAAAELGGLDAVVNAAGVVRPGDMRTTGPDDWRLTFEVNVLGLLHVTHASLPYLRESTMADIVNLSSMSGRRRASVEMTIYSASKFAVHVISDGLREELSPDGVRVTLVSPGYVHTPIFDHVADADRRARYQDAVATKGLDPTAVAAQVVYALSQPPGVNLVELAVMSTKQ